MSQSEKIFTYTDIIVGCVTSFIKDNPYCSFQAIQEATTLSTRTLELILRKGEAQKVLFFDSERQGWLLNNSSPKESSE